MGKTHFADIPDNVFAAYIGSAASGATNTAQTIGWFLAPADCKLESAYIVASAAAWTGAATNYQNLRVINKGTAGAGTTEMALLSVSSTAITVGSGAALAITPSSTAANLLASSGDVICYTIAQSGDGQVYPIHHVHLLFSFQ